MLYGASRPHTECFITLIAVKHKLCCMTKVAVLYDSYKLLGSTHAKYNKNELNCKCRIYSLRKASPCSPKDVSMGHSLLAWEGLKGAVSR